MISSKNIITLVYLSLIAAFSYGILLLTEHAVPGLPVFVPVYIGVIYFFTHSTLSDRKNSLFDGAELYDHTRIANLVIVGGLFSGLVYLLRNHLETDITPDLQRSLLYWQLLFGFLASALIPKLIILNQGLFRSLFSIKPYLLLIMVWILSFGLMSVFDSAVLSVGVITFSTAILAVIQFNSIRSKPLG